MKPEDIAEWWKKASSDDREEFLSLIYESACLVSSTVWYVHPYQGLSEEK